MTEHECDSIADAVATASAIALNWDEPDPVRILADQLAEQVDKTV